ncbi:MAG TPA: hypothetical protein ENK06_02055 [Gammaproteobacteria bacterium]|nr:hypothetical protein [Gammaproteobacteria bacterium]
MAKHCCIVIYSNSQLLEEALVALQAAGCDLGQASVVARACQAKGQPLGIYHIDDCVHFLGQQRIFGGRLTGSGFFWEPDFGPLMASGPIVNIMVRGLEDVDIGAGFSLLGAALFSVGVPRGIICEYERMIRAEKFLLLFHGEWQDVEHVCSVLHVDTQQVTVHCAQGDFAK